MGPLRTLRPVGWGRASAGRCPPGSRGPPECLADRPGHSLRCFKPRPSPPWLSFHSSKTVGHWRYIVVRCKALRPRRILWCRQTITNEETTYHKTSPIIKPPAIFQTRFQAPRRGGGGSYTRPKDPLKYYYFRTLNFSRQGINQFSYISEHLSYFLFLKTVLRNCLP